MKTLKTFNVNNRANPHRFSFDDISSAMLALFEVLSFKGWVDIREALLKRFDDSVSIELFIHNSIQKQVSRKF